MACQRLPVEIWEEILSYSVEIPGFFEADPIEQCGFDQFIGKFDDQAAYWQAERHRNNLRCVCSTWDCYLIQFNHRLVTILDVERGNVPLTAIVQAIRLESQPMGPSYVTFDVAQIIIRNALLAENSWSLQISRLVYRLTEPIIQSGKAPLLRNVLRTMHILNAQTANYWAQNLRFIQGISISQTDHCFRAPLVTTLIVMITSLEVFLLCKLPSLQHLSIESRKSRPFSSEEIILIVQSFGESLITFFDNSFHGASRVPQAIWSLCPKLERFQTSLMWLSKPYIPSSLRYLHVSKHMFYYSWRKRHATPAMIIPVASLHAAGINTVVLSQYWNSILDLHGADYSCVVYAMNGGLTFRDAAGIRFQDFIVDMIQHKKRGVRRRKDLPAAYYGF